jgi:16S rRNA (guanine527-N7)-methyltransferase
MSDFLKQGLADLQIPVTQDQLDQFQKYMELVLENNEKVNLTAIKDPEEFHVKHYLDSVAIYNRKEYVQAKTIIDVGTGGGFPGVPLAILNPEKKFLLMDSLRKRMDLVREMCLESGILNVEVIHARAEELARQKSHREKYDLCVSRAVADLAVLSEYCIPFIRVGGFFVSYKGGDAVEEINNAKKAIRTLGGKLIATDKMEICGQSRTIVTIEKVVATNKSYPRKPGTPAKMPIR